MLSGAIRILDFDGSVTRQLQIAARAAQIVELRALGRNLRFMATRSAMEKLACRLDASTRNAVTFLGSGDFHHVSAALLAQWKRPLSLIVFDAHPDFDVTSPWPCCGSWINVALQQSNVKKVVVIGLGRADLRGWHLLRGNRSALQSGRLELFPASWPRSKTLTRRGASTRVWETVAQNGLDFLMQKIIAGLPTREIYLSIDKDCLSARHAFTNWEEGELSLLDLENALRLLTAKTDILGADITGEYSRGTIRNPLFRLISHMDHPASTRVSTTAFATNQATNLALLRALNVS